MQTDYIQSIEQTPFKTGHSAKTGKDWALYGVTTKNGIKGSTFDGDLVTGDEVIVEKNGEYYNISKPSKQAKQAVEQESKLKKLWELNLAIYKAITGEDYTGVQKETTSAQKPVTEPVQTSETPPVEAYTDIDEVDLSNIPFN